MAVTRSSLEHSDTRASVDKMETGTTHKEHQAGNGLLSLEDMRFLESFTENNRKKVIRKVDVRRFPISQTSPRTVVVLMWRAS